MEQFVYREGAQVKKVFHLGRKKMGVSEITGHAPYKGWALNTKRKNRKEKKG
jgi:hypothetical protein